jgi:hypothetical protein
MEELFEKIIYNEKKIKLLVERNGYLKLGQRRKKIGIKCSIDFNFTKRTHCLQIKSLQNP